MKLFGLISKLNIDPIKLVRKMKLFGKINLKNKIIQNWILLKY